jgi:hypothetical protein
VFENRVLRRIIGPRRDEVMGGLRILHKEELSDLYSSSSVIGMVMSRKMRLAGHVARIGEENKNVYMLFVVKPEGRRLVERPRHSWVDNIRIDRVVWTGLVWLRMGTSGELL